MCKMMIQSIEQKADQLELQRKAVELARTNLFDSLNISESLAKGHEFTHDSVAYLCEKFLDEFHTLKQLENAKPSEL